MIQGGFLELGVLTNIFKKEIPTSADSFFCKSDVLREHLNHLVSSGNRNILPEINRARPAARQVVRDINRLESMDHCRKSFKIVALFEIDTAQGISYEMKGKGKSALI